MDKKKLVLDAALRLFVDHGFHGTATSKIASEAAVATGTLFNLFHTKEELIISLYQIVSKDMEDYIVNQMESHSISKNTFRSLFLTQFKWCSQNPFPYYYIQQFNHSPYIRMQPSEVSKLEEHPLYILIQNAIAVVLIKPLPVLFIFTIFSSQTKGLIDYILLNNLAAENETELINESFEMLWKMIEE
jgi:AcrR family transcriptional regulator